MSRYTQRYSSIPDGWGRWLAFTLDLPFHQRFLVLSLKGQKVMARIDSLDQPEALRLALDVFAPRWSRVDFWDDFAGAGSPVDQLRLLQDRRGVGGAAAGAVLAAYHWGPWGDPWVEAQHAAVSQPSALGARFIDVRMPPLSVVELARDVLADYAETVDPDAVLLEGRMPSLVDVDHSLVLFSGLVKDGRIGHAPEPEIRRLPQWWPGE